MRKIEAVVRPEKLGAVKDALVALGHAGLTVTEVKGHGIQKGVTQQWRGQEYSIDLLPKIMVMAVVNDHEVADVVDAICDAARTGMIGDGKIFVSGVEDIIRIRTGEGGPTRFDAACRRYRKDKKAGALASAFEVPMAGTAFAPPEAPSQWALLGVWWPAKPSRRSHLPDHPGAYARSPLWIAPHHMNRLERFLLAAAQAPRML